MSCTSSSLYNMRKRPAITDYILTRPLYCVALHAASTPIICGCVHVYRCTSHLLVVKPSFTCGNITTTAEQARVWMNRMSKGSQRDLKNLLEVGVEVQEAESKGVYSYPSQSPATGRKFTFDFI